MLKILKFFYPLVTALYLWWSRRYRWLFLYSYASIPVPRYKEPQEVLELTQKVKWRKDGFLQLYDVVGTAQRFQFILNELQSGGVQPDLACDCDDFAAYCCEALHPHYHPHMFLVAYRKPSGLGGHAVCTFTYKSVNGADLYHIGNWGMVGPFSTYRALAEGIAKTVGAELIGYTTANYDLTEYTVTKAI